MQPSAEDEVLTEGVGTASIIIPPDLQEKISQKIELFKKNYFEYSETEVWNRIAEDLSKECLNEYRKNKDCNLDEVISRSRYKFFMDSLDQAAELQVLKGLSDAYIVEFKQRIFKKCFDNFQKNKTFDVQRFITSDREILFFRDFMSEVYPILCSPAERSEAFKMALKNFKHNIPFNSESILAKAKVGNYRPEIVSDNPRKLKADITSNYSLIRWMKLTYKARKENLYNLIIPSTSAHGSWTLGAQISKERFENFEKENPNVLRVSMLTDQEMEDRIGKKGNLYRFHWFDHGTIDKTTGFNQNSREFLEHQKIIYRQHAKGRPVYCHCMAGRSRSYFETIIFLKVNSDKIFDWLEIEDDTKKQILQEMMQTLCKQKQRENLTWKKIKLDPKTKLPVDRSYHDKLKVEVDSLVQALMDHPTAEEIASFVRLRRPNVKPLEKLGNGQGNLLGLTSLHDLYDNFEYYSQSRERLSAVIKSCRFLLEAPLSSAFRETNDLLQQYKELDQITEKLRQLDPPIDFYQQLNQYLDESFLSDPARRVRLAVLLQRDRTSKENLYATDLSETTRSVIGILQDKKRFNKVPVGDLIALMEVYPEDLARDTKLVNSLAERIVNSSDQYDKYNAGIQLAKLKTLIPNDFNLQDYVNKLKKTEYNKYCQACTKSRINPESIQQTTYKKLPHIPAFFAKWLNFSSTPKDKPKKTPKEAPPSIKLS